MTVLMVSFLAASAQSIWDKAHLARVRESLGRPAYAVAYRQLLDDADKKLAAEPVSVMMKEKTPASGDKHDYMSLSRYFWPDPSKPDGLPYISRDGVSNPELERYDRNRLSTMADGVTTLSLAWYFSGDEKYARKAVEYLKVWEEKDADGRVTAARYQTGCKRVRFVKPASEARIEQGRRIAQMAAERRKEGMNG